MKTTKTTKTTRQEIAEFQTAFERPLNQVLLECPSVSDRLLLGKLLLEEVVETLCKGLGLTIYGPDGVVADGYSDLLTLEHTEGRTYDPIETADGLGDVNVVIHFIAHWLGMNLDRITSEIHRSNMSKLGEDGKPIINGVTPGYRGGIDWKATLAAQSGRQSSHDSDFQDEAGFDPSNPAGKILKGPNFTTPDLGPILAAGNWISEPITGYVSPTEIRPDAQLDHCPEHHDQTTENCEGGYGLAGGGLGAYYLCGTCGRVFGKTDDDDDF